MTQSEYEIVHTMTDYWDGPRGGVADFNGLPHVYQSEFDETEDDWLSTFLLMPIDLATFQLAIEDWAIWRRYETAFCKGEATSASHPALPEESQRHHELALLLEKRLAIDPSRSIRAKGAFRAREDRTWSGLGWPPLEVKWTVVAVETES